MVETGLQEKSECVKSGAARTGNRHRWAGRESRGARVNHSQGTRQINPVTSGEGDPPQGGRREMAQATVYQKHMAMPNRKMTYMA